MQEILALREKLLGRGREGGIGVQAGSPFAVGSGGAGGASLGEPGNSQGWKDGKSGISFPSPSLTLGRLEFVGWAFPASLLFPGILAAPRDGAAGAAPVAIPLCPKAPCSHISHRQCLENPANRERTAGKLQMWAGTAGMSCIQVGLYLDLVLEIPVPVPGVFDPKSSRCPLCDHFWGKKPLISAPWRFPPLFRGDFSRFPEAPGGGSPWSRSAAPGTALCSASPGLPAIPGSPELFSSQSHPIRDLQR